MDGIQFRGKLFWNGEHTQIQRNYKLRRMFLCLRFESKQSNASINECVTAKTEPNHIYGVVYAFDVYICETVTLFASCGYVCSGEFSGPVGCWLIRGPVVVNS